MAPATQTVLTSLGVNIATASDSTRVVNAITSIFNYQPILTDMLGNPTPNPESPTAFAQRMMVSTVKGWVETYESQQAAATAGANAQQVGVS